ncbi:hypothetical protein ACU4GD_16570 [Cupriavidus basilensis]
MSLVAAGAWCFCGARLHAPPGQRRHCLPRACPARPVADCPAAPGDAPGQPARQPSYACARWCARCCRRKGRPREDRHHDLSHGHP